MVDLYEKVVLFETVFSLPAILSFHVVYLISYFYISSLVDLTKGEKVKRVLWNYILRPICLLFLIYMFICSLDFLSSAFRLLGGKINR